MIYYIGLFIGGLILFFFESIVWAKLYDEKINFKNAFLYISIIILTLLSILNHMYVNAFVRIVVITVIMCFCNWMIFRKKINEVIISTVFSQLLLTIADVIFALLVVGVFGQDTDFIKNYVFDTFIGNIIVAFIFILISKFKIIKKMYIGLINLTDKIEIDYWGNFCVLLIISLSFLMAIIYYDLKSIYVIIINSLLLFIYSFIVYKSANEKSINIMVKAENKSLMTSLKEYENMVDRQRVDNHENKNQLLIIKNMIKKKDKDVVEYIDTIVKDEHEEDEALYTRVKTIPTGGLQGIIYQKMLTMKSENILFSLDVSRDVRKIDLSNFSMEDNYKLCKIIGVVLDNAIEESKNLDDKVIMISLYVDEGLLVIDISNRFKSDVEVDKIDKEGYTTKGDGHGYGLSLVKQIVDESNGKFINDRKVTKDIFKQVIKVKIQYKKTVRILFLAVL